MSSDESLSLRERVALVRTLSGLPAAQVEQLIFAMKPPFGVVPPSSAPVATRTAELLNWCEGSSGPGLRELQKCLDSLLIDEKTALSSPLSPVESELFYGHKKHARSRDSNQSNTKLILKNNDNKFRWRKIISFVVLIASIFSAIFLTFPPPFLEYFPEKIVYLIMSSEEDAVADRWLEYIYFVNNRDIRSAYGMLSTRLQGRISYQSYKLIFEDTVDMDLLALRNVDVASEIASMEVYFEKTSGDGTREDWHGNLIFKKEKGVWFIDSMSGLKRSH